MLRGWFKNKADGHLQEKNCSGDQQPTQSRCFSPAERMDGSEQMKVWIEKAWRRRQGGLGMRKSRLVYDAFEAHVTDTVKAAFKRENTDLAVIPWRVNINSPAPRCIFKQAV